MVTPSRIQLRPLRDSDLRTLLAWWSEREASYLDGGDPAGPDLDFRQDLIHRIRSGELDSWYIIEDEGGSAIGYVLYRAYSGLERELEVALRISEYYWGRGYGTASMVLLLDRLFTVAVEDGPVDSVWLTVFVFNTRAIRLYEKLGFEVDESFMDERGFELFRMSLSRARWERENSLETLLSLDRASMNPPPEPADTRSTHRG